MFPAQLLISMCVLKKLCSNSGGVCCALAGMLEFFHPGPYFVAIAVLIREIGILKHENW